MGFQVKILGSIAALALTLPCAPAAQAGDAAAAAAGAFIGSVLGNAVTQPRRERVIVREQPRTVVRTVRAPAPAVNTYEREQNRQAQVALNHFGFPAGTPDGVMGRNSRAAAAQYQAFMGMPASGYLSDYERTQLISAHNRALVGGPQNQQMMAAYGQGARSLLLGYRDEQMGAPMPGAGAPALMAAAPFPAPAAPAAAAALITAAPVVTVPAPEIAAPAPEGASPETAAPAGLPTFLAAAPEASMAGHCNRVSLVTSTNGGFVTLASLKDPNVALQEQFCLARTYAIEEGDDLAAKVQGVSAAEIQTQCEAFAPAMRPYVAMLGGEPLSKVLEGVRGFIVQSNAPPAAILGNARICLGVGYRTDNAELALGSALLLDAAGDVAYGEHVGHHLMQGFGVPRRVDRGADWMGEAIDAMQGGAAQVVAPGAPERVALLRRSLDVVAGKPAETLTDAAAPGSAALPGFHMPAGAPN